MKESKLVDSKQSGQIKFSPVQYIFFCLADKINKHLTAGQSERAPVVEPVLSRELTLSKKGQGEEQNRPHESHFCQPVPNNLPDTELRQQQLSKHNK